MNVEDDIGEYVWPPQRSGDSLLVDRVLELIATPTLFQHHYRAWERLNETGLAIEPGCSLLDELYSQSGTFSKPFLDIAVSDIFLPELARPTLSRTLQAILTDFPLSSSLESDEISLDDSIRADQALELYRGCVWEISASFACVLVNESLCLPGRPPASCREPGDRAHFLKEANV
jgi:hypothetical protein